MCYLKRRSGFIIDIFGLSRACLRGTITRYVVQNLWHHNISFHLHPIHPRNLVLLFFEHLGAVVASPFVLLN